MNDPQRDKIRAALERYFERRWSTRFILCVIVILTAVAGFLFSRLMLYFHLKMVVRYPLAVVGAYAVCLGLLRLWASIERMRFDAAAEKEISGDDQPATPSPYAKKKWSWLDFIIFPGLIGDDIFSAILGLVISIAFCLAIFLVGLFFSAEALAAEVFFDTILMAILYKHFKTATRQHWLGATIRRTWIPVLVIAAGLSFLGFELEAPPSKPEKESIGDFLRNEALKLNRNR